MTVAVDIQAEALARVTADEVAKIEQERDDARRAKEARARTEQERADADAAIREAYDAVQAADEEFTAQLVAVNDAADAMSSALRTFKAAQRRAFALGIPDLPVYSDLYVRSARTSTGKAARDLIARSKANGLL